MAEYAPKGKQIGITGRLRNENLGEKMISNVKRPSHHRSVQHERRPKVVIPHQPQSDMPRGTLNRQIQLNKMASYRDVDLDTPIDLTSTILIGGRERRHHGRNGSGRLKKPPVTDSRKPNFYK